MDVENTVYRIVLAIFTIAAVWVLLNIKSLYKDPKKLPVEPPAWWPYSKGGWRMWARAIPLFAPLTLPLSLGATLDEYVDTSGPVIGSFFLLLAFIFFSGSLFGIFVALTGRPKWIIPRHLR